MKKQHVSTSRRELRCFETWPGLLFSKGCRFFEQSSDFANVSGNGLQIEGAGLTASASRSVIEFIFKLVAEFYLDV